MLLNWFFTFPRRERSWSEASWLRSVTAINIDERGGRGRIEDERRGSIRNLQSSSRLAKRGISGFGSGSRNLRGGIPRHSLAKHARSTFSNRFEFSNAHLVVSTFRSHLFACSQIDDTQTISIPFSYYDFQQRRTSLTAVRNVFYSRDQYNDIVFFFFVINVP